LYFKRISIYASFALYVEGNILGLIITVWNTLTMFTFFQRNPVRHAEAPPHLPEEDVVSNAEATPSIPQEDAEVVEEEDFIDANEFDTFEAASLNVELNLDDMAQNFFAHVDEIH